MAEIDREKPSALFRVRLQASVCAAFALLLATLVGSLYLQDRQREWTLRCEQARHRLDVAYRLVSREVDRVRADVLFLADQEAVRQFVGGNPARREALRREYAHFLTRKKTYDQIRLLDLGGRETIRVNYAADRAAPVGESELQDKSDRYYFEAALTLHQGEVFVSEFDLNVEHSQLERPLNPVIRFVTPVADVTGNVNAFLVLNYRGARLLHGLDDSTLPGATLLLRPDSNYVRGIQPGDEWGWLLGHGITFAAHFPEEWSQIDDMQECQLTSNGAFAAKRIPLGKTTQDALSSTAAEVPPLVSGAEQAKDSILAVSYLPRDQVFKASNESLRRLLLLAGCVFIPVAVFARYWAHAIWTRHLQAQKIAASEEQLRELSSRLLRIQEEERRAISREIHDEFGQQVTAINLDLKLAERNMESGSAKSHLERAVCENESLLHSLHAFATRVRPAVLDDLGLRDAVESHVAEFQRRTGIEVETDLQFEPTEIPNEIADNAYRLLQESMNNVLKHADATRVWVKMLIDSGQQPRFFVSVRDNGRGCEPSRNGGGLGLIGMRERVDLLSGEFFLHSGAEEGTNIEIWLPLRTAQPSGGGSP